MSAPNTPDRTLLAALAVAALVFVVVVLVSLLSGDTKPQDELRWMEHLDIPLEVVPIGVTAVAAPGTSWVPAAKQHLLVYLDTSHPMGGFIPSYEAGSGSLSPYRAVTQLLVDDLVQIYGGTGDTVSWLSIAEQLHLWSDYTTARDLKKRPEPRFVREEFAGSETCLDQAIAHAIGALEAGEAQVAALVTDMVATCGVTGAVGVSQALSDWVFSPAVLGGGYNLALYGVRLPYTGVTSKTCPATLPTLGCWFSERDRSYRPLSQPASRPLYFLILSRSANAVGVDERLTRLGQALAADVGKLGLEGQWEVLSEANAGRDATLSCRAPADQRTLLRAESGLYKCQLGEPVHLDCALDLAGSPTGSETSVWRPREVVLSWPDELASATVGEGRIGVTIDCDAVQTTRPKEPLRLRRVSLELADLAPLWRDWSSVSDEREADLGGTLQLARFVESLKHREYVAKAELAILRR